MLKERANPTSRSITTTSSWGGKNIPWAALPTGRTLSRAVKKTWGQSIRIQNASGKEGLLLPQNGGRRST